MWYQIREGFRDEIRENIRLNLIDLRKKKQINQAELAEIVGKSKTGVASWEQGKSLPDLVTLFILSDFYGVTLEYIYGKRGG